MKKLALIAIIGLGSLTAFAQVSDPAQQTTDPTQQQTTDPAQQTTDPTQRTTDPTQPQTTDPTQQTIDPTQQRTTDPTQRRTTDPAQQTAEQETSARSQDGYGEIDMKEVPSAVNEAIKKGYPKAKVNKAYTNEKGQYRLEVGMEEGASETMFMDKEGNPLEQ